MEEFNRGNRTVVVYHSADFDGIFCREIAKRHLGEGAHYIGWDYGDPVPDVAPDAPLYLLDISIESLMDHPVLIWIDHHKSSIEKYGRRKGLQIDGVAACRLAWQWFNFNKIAAPSSKDDFMRRRLSEPISVRLAGEYDVCDKRDPWVDPFQLGLKAKSLTAAHWKHLLTPGIASESVVTQLVGDGITIGRYKAAEDSRVMAACAFDVDFEGLSFLALNTARCSSDTFMSAVHPRHDGLLAFRHDGRQWSVSLYGLPGKPDIDLSAIAVKYGGGGHKQACGFRAPSLPFIESAK